MKAINLNGSNVGIVVTTYSAITIIISIIEEKPSELMTKPSNLKQTIGNNKQDLQIIKEMYGWITTTDFTSQNQDISQNRCQ